MIHVERPDASDAVTDALDKRGRFSRMSEAEWAMWFYEDIVPSPRNPMPIKPAEAPDFKVYKEDAVKELLHEIFGGHCAYCESRYSHVVKMDVEHYRPKGAVAEDDGTKKVPGYYWLAATWENLLPSCNLCNRAGTQMLTYADGSTVEGTKGKANFFPLQAGTARAAKKGDELNEEPLLLDPCNPNHDPQKHLVFRSDGLVEPRTSPEEQATPRGMATIDTCALHRSSLVEVRRVEATRLRDAMAGILRADTRCFRNPGDQTAEDDRAEEEAELVALMPDLNFRAMATELLALFGTIRTSVQDYYEALDAWRGQKGQVFQNALVARATTLRKLHDEADLHQPFVAELLRIARIPLSALA